MNQVIFSTILVLGMILTLSVSKIESWKFGYNDADSTITIRTFTIPPCEALFGECDCENGKSICCFDDQCVTTTIAAVTAHNKCQKK